MPKENDQYNPLKNVRVDNKQYQMESQAQVYFIRVLQETYQKDLDAQQSFLDKDEVLERMNSWRGITYKNAMSLDSLMAKTNTHLKKIEAPFRVIMVKVGPRFVGLLLSPEGKYGQYNTVQKEDVNYRSRQ